MIRLPRIAWPKRIATQLLLLLVGATIVFQAGVFIMQARHPVHVGSQPFDVARLPMQMQPLVLVIDGLQLLPTADRDRYLTKVNKVVPERVVNLLPATAPEPDAPVDPLVASQLIRHLPPGTRVAASREGLLQIRCPGGLVVQVRSTDFTPPTPNGGIIAVTLTVMIGCGVFFLAYAYLNLKRPLSTFAAAVDRFGLDQSFEAVSEKGPVEIAAVARVFNRMQTRITTMMADRTRTLASLGHDLRTPITRLRLRAEKVSDPPLRGALIRDLDYMQRMAHAALTFLRDDQPVPRAPIDVASLLQTICDEADEMGHRVAYDGPVHLIVVARIDELRRAVTNLVSNAVFQDASVIVTLCMHDAETIEIDVVDDGPGIPDAEKAAVFEPFRRGARSASDRTGFGLGLSIVHNMARSHNGEVTLHDRPGGGLICRLRLPRGECGDALTAPPNSPPIPATRITPQVRA